MNNLMRPALYDAHHQILPIKKTNKLFRGKLEFVGPVCESSDKFLTQKKQLIVGISNQPSFLPHTSF